jgi:hypothetical protein
MRDRSVGGYHPLEGGDSLGALQKHLHSDAPVTMKPEHEARIESTVALQGVKLDIRDIRQQRDQPCGHFNDNFSIHSVHMLQIPGELNHIGITLFELHQKPTTFQRLPSPTWLRQRAMSHSGRIQSGFMGGPSNL